MIDAHCHLNFTEYDDDRDEVLFRARQVGVKNFLVIGTSLETSEKALALAKKEKDIAAVVGVHPTEIEHLPEHWVSQLKTLALDPEVVAIGEIGLDYYHTQETAVHKKQQEIFVTQLEIAHEVGKPVQIHNRHAGEDLMQILNEHSQILLNQPGMLHCFASSLDVLRQALDLGFYIGIDGNVTYPGLAKGESVTIPEIVRTTPLERIITETDSPYLTPIPYRGSRNEPQHVILVAAEIARIKGVSAQEVEEQVHKNVSTLFGI